MLPPYLDIIELQQTWTLRKLLHVVHAKSHDTTRQLTMTMEMSRGSMAENHAVITRTCGAGRVISRNCD
jgi:hypothetical protein